MPPSYQSEIVATASAALLGVIGTIAITKPDLAGGAVLNEGVMRWLLYCIAGGLVINTQSGRPLRVLFVASLFSSVVLVATMCFMSFIGGAIRVSGQLVSIRDNSDVFWILIAFLFFVTTVAITTACYARPMVLHGLQTLTVERASCAASDFKPFFWLCHFSHLLRFRGSPYLKVL